MLMESLRMPHVNSYGGDPLAGVPLFGGGTVIQPATAKNTPESKSTFSDRDNFFRTSSTLRSAIVDYKLENSKLPS